MIVKDKESSKSLQKVSIPEGATHYHRMNKVIFFYKRQDLYQDGDGKKWMIWSCKQNRWSRAIVNTVHVQSNGLPHGFLCMRGLKYHTKQTFCPTL